MFHAILTHVVNVPARVLPIGVMRLCFLYQAPGEDVIRANVDPHLTFTRNDVAVLEKEGLVCPISRVPRVGIMPETQSVYADMRDGESNSRLWILDRYYPLFDSSAIYLGFSLRILS